MRKIVVFILCLLLVGCSSKQDLEEAEKRIAVLEDSIEQLRNTPHQRLARIKSTLLCKALCLSGRLKSAIGRF